MKTIKRKPIDSSNGSNSEPEVESLRRLVATLEARLEKEYVFYLNEIEFLKRSHAETITICMEVLARERKLFQEEIHQLNAKLRSRPIRRILKRRNVEPTEHDQLS